MKTDLEIQKDVMEEIEWDPILCAAEIGVSVKEGVVMLNGYVDTYSKKLAAENATKRVKDVKGIAEEIEVRLSTNGIRTDTELVEAAVNALMWNVDVPDEKIKVKVEKGWLTLEGNVDWRFQKDEATLAVKSLIGLKGINNFIHVKTTEVHPDSVKNLIKNALERSADVEAGKVTIEAIGNTVTLKGNVHSWLEKNEVERAAWSAPGVTHVKDELLVI